VLRKLLDRIAAIAEDALLAVDEGDGGRARAGIETSGIERDVAGLLAERLDVDRPLAFGALDRLEFDGLAIDVERGRVERRGGRDEVLLRGMNRVA